MNEIVSRTLYLRKETDDLLREMAKTAGMSLNDLTVQVIEEKLIQMIKVKDIFAQIAPIKEKMLLDAIPSTLAALIAQINALDGASE